MGYAIELSDGRIAELHMAAEAPPNAIAVSDADGEILRRTSRFADYRLDNTGKVVFDPLPTTATPTTPSVTPWQIRKALNATGDRAAVEAAIAAADQTTRDGWEFATEFRRDDPLVIAMGAALGKTPEEIDALFELAGSL